ncbi:MAG: Cof-type HAD-IIB family hydrolase [Roseburia sp.]
MNNKKILFSDLDGTLLGKDKTISAKNREAIQKMLKQGHYFVIATGRPVASGREVAKDLGLTLPGCYMIAFNGAVLYDCAADRILVKESLQLEHVLEIFEKAEEAGIYVQTYTSLDVITKKHTKELDYYIKNTKMKYKLTKKIYDVLQEEPQKVLLISLDDKEKLEKFQKDNLAWEKGKCHSFFSCDEYLEYCPVETDKGHAIHYITKILDVPHENTIAIGDETNDIFMIKTANLGIAVANARNEVKKAANYVTVNDYEHDAIAEVIEKFILNE